MINRSDFYTQYIEIFKSNGLDEFCDEKTVEKMLEMSNYMLEVNQHMNLTAITETADIIAKHLADSVIVARYIPQNSRVCDVGCGGGFPSLPLAIARPDITLIGIDSTEKRINYVNDSAKRLDLTNITAICGRAEELGHQPQLRECFDICVARAVANLPILSELCVPFVKVGGAFVAMKGRLNDDELKADTEKLGTEAISQSNVTHYQLVTARGNEERHMISLKKLSITPDSYPRNYSQIKKKPL